MADLQGNTKLVGNFMMDGEFLTQLLECPVCLGELTSNNRVLPCQHTFCLRCLHEVVKAKKRLDCPECRAPVNIPSQYLGHYVQDYLPRNILLVRFLEGIKNKKVRSFIQHQPQAPLPQFSTMLPTATDVYKKMKEDPQYKAVIFIQNGSWRVSEVSAPGKPPQPSTLVNRIPIPGQPSQPYTSWNRIPGQPLQPYTSGNGIPVPGQPSLPSTSVNRMSVPGQPSPLSIALKNIPPPDKNAVALENLRRLNEALKSSQAVISNLWPKNSAESNKSTHESRFRKRNKHILSKMVRALTYPNCCSYTAPRTKSGST